MAQSKAYLKELRRKFGLGEFAGRKRPAKAKAKQRRRASSPAPRFGL